MSESEVTVTPSLQAAESRDRGALNVAPCTQRPEAAAIAPVFGRLHLLVIVRVSAEQPPIGTGQRGAEAEDGVAVVG